MSRQEVVGYANVQHAGLKWKTCAISKHFVSKKGLLNQLNS
jgi:hypothetical protein